MDFRSVILHVGSERVKQLCVVGVAVEYFWKLAFHGRRGLNSLVWSDVPSATLRDVVRIDGAGRPRRWGIAEVALTRADSMLALRVARAVCKRVEESGFRIFDAIVAQKDQQ